MFAEQLFPAEAVSAAAARRFAGSTLRSWGHEDLVPSTELLISELVINAVLHAGSSAHLRLRLSGDCLRVEVRDESTIEIRPRVVTTDSPSGRGLLILDAVADEWGVDCGCAGKTVWFQLVTSEHGGCL